MRIETRERTYSLSRNTVLSKIANREMEWIEEGVSARWITWKRGYRSGYAPLSGLLEVKQSGYAGPLVLQIV